MATGKTISFPKGQRSSASAERVAKLVKFLFEANSTGDKKVITRAHQEIESQFPGLTRDEIRCGFGIHLEYLDERLARLLAHRSEFMADRGLH